ncbi:protein phosphatase CheZ [Azospira inquinata]|uniref:Protein phosphatase CheZ n=1 Tax=Azospira inquinata TaxID=2785627 RepID=A0A975SQM5_9RHOO|nr:protein phosphatase CheZ [Azospira inquinata]QWT47212.1 protein phosphatase CheZ [Azospira inquinata]QWT50159.1 protein phosphatase CheZ [Azospira inquinata]
MAHADNTQHEVFNQLGKMTRNLHKTLGDLGQDNTLEKTVAEIPDTRERLNYVLTMTEQAVSRVLNAVDAISPSQDQMQTRLAALEKAWAQCGDGDQLPAPWRDALAQTRGFFAQLDQEAANNKAQLTEIVMAQEFQDVTGQVIKKIVDLAQDMESQLLSILARTAPKDLAKPAKTETGASPLLNGPAMASEKETQQALGSQAEVDSFLDSLGF